MPKGEFETMSMPISRKVGTLAPGQMAATAKPDGYTIAQIPITIFRFPS